MTITPSRITEMPEAPEYRFARLCIARLQAQGLIPHEAILPAPFDNKDQCDKLTGAAGKFDGVVAVIPLPLRDDNPQAQSGVLTVRLAVAAFVTPNTINGVKPQDAASRLMAAIVRSLYRWAPEGNGIPYAAVTLEGVELLDAADYEGMKNLHGLSLTLAKGMSYLAN